MLLCDHVYTDVLEHAILSETLIMMPNSFGEWSAFYVLDKSFDLLSWVHPAVLENIVKPYWNTGGIFYVHCAFRKPLWHRTFPSVHKQSTKSEIKP